MYEPDRRPSVVTAASVILFIAAGLVIIGCVIALGSGLLTSAGNTIVLLQLGLSVLTIVLAAKILGGSNGARITIIVFQSINIVLAVIGGLEGTAILGIGLNLLVIGLLAWNRDAQDYFAGHRQGRVG